jgi:hypothetical protein
MCFLFGFEILKRILRLFQKCAEVLSLEEGKTFFTEILIFRHFENFAKQCFSENKIFGNLTQEIYTFLKTA